MPYPTRESLPQSVRSDYSEHCQDVFRNAWNSIYSAHSDEGRAFAGAHAAAQRCQGGKSMATDLGSPTKLPPMPPLKYGEFRFQAIKALEAFTSPEEGKKRFRFIASSTIRDRQGDEITLPALEKMRERLRSGLT